MLVSAETQNLGVVSAAEISQAIGWRDLAVEGLFRTGGVSLIGKLARKRRVPVPRLAILCYHRIGTGGVPFYSQLAAENFEAQMYYLRKNYRVLSLDQLIQEMKQPTNLEPAVAVTFDDGYRGLFAEAFPILTAHQIPATIFLTVGAIETGEVAWYDRIFLALQVAPGNTFDIELDQPRHFDLDSSASRMQAAAEIISCLRAFSPERRKKCCLDLENRIPLPEDQLRGRMLTWDQIRVMHHGGISFGAHTMTHPVVSRLSPVEMEWEILESKRILENRLSAPVRHFAFPFGKQEECGDAAVSLLAGNGFASAATTEWGLNSVGTNPLQLRRVQIGEMGSLAMFAFQLNRLFLQSDFGETGAMRQEPFSGQQNVEIETQRVRQ